MKRSTHALLSLSMSQAHGVVNNRPCATSSLKAVRLLMVMPNTARVCPPLARRYSSACFSELDRFRPEFSLTTACALLACAWIRYEENQRPPAGA